METIAEQDIQEIPLSSPFFRAKVARFLEDNGLRPEVLDSYYALQSSDGSLLAGAGLAGDVVKCVAVSSSLRSEGLLTPLLSHLVSQAASKGILNLKVFTKPEYQTIFESLGFRLLARAPLAILMENGRGLEEYCSYLRKHQAPGVIIMNANPFTLGHRYLISQALNNFATPWPYSISSKSKNLAIIPVREDVSMFSYEERREMILKGADEDADVLEGSAYQISAATFPTYFLKDLSEASETQMRLDIDLFGRHIAPALGASIRFVGAEPSDPLTARYNKLMKELLPRYKVMVVELPRATDHGKPISAARVREALEGGDFESAAALTPASTHPYLLAALAERALLAELNAPLKPGLVGPDGSGAHSDMDYELMLRSIRALRPYWSQIAEAAGADQLRSLGIAAEEAMLAATGGVNTHRGAIFALGLALNARADSSRISALAEQICAGNRSLGARQMALDGYKPLFEDWLPYYRSLEGDELQVQKTLLRIMSTLDDTCIIHRVGSERAQEVKAEASSTSDLKELCARYASERISPGGAADMLALTIFINSILKTN
jgi:[citrate (pro-3S)-lyase] ligase